MTFGLFIRAAALALGAVSLAAAGQGWMVTFAETDSGHRMGDPEAPVQLIEFVSYTCPHCATFERLSEGTLKLGYVHQGKAAVEIKHLIRDRVDLAVAMLARCGAANKFFGNHTALMLAQPDWFATGAGLSPAQTARWETGSVGQRQQAIARDLGLYDIMAMRGYEPIELDRCLADRDAADAVLARSMADADVYGVQGTPSFVINGELAEGVHSWPLLNDRLVELTAK